MSQVAPNGVIRLFKDVPLDLKHEDTITFATRSAQQSYFLGLTPLHVMANSTRVRDGVISLNVGEDAIREANYMMFQNLNFADKWFYAYVLRTEYVNNNMTYVYYKIDAMQTYGLDIDFMECFVEREHVTDDTKYKNIIDEGFNCSEYVEQSEVVKPLRNNAMIIWSGSHPTDDPDKPISVATPHCFGGVFTGLGATYAHVMNDNGEPISAGLNAIFNFLNDMADNEQTESIVCGTMFDDSLMYISSEEPSDPTKPLVYTMTFPTVNNIDGYVPKNNKMFNSPYYINTIECSDGQVEILQPELFVNPNSSHFCVLYPCVSENPSVTALPMGYKGQGINYEYGITFTDFYQFGLAIDGYKAWVASGGKDKLIANTAFNVASDTANLAMSTFLGDGQGMLGSSLSLMEDISNAIIASNVAKKLPPNVKGTTTGAPMLANNIARFTIGVRTIRADVARSIDDYFTMYGYRVNKVKKPSLKNRSRFTYVKTRGCKVVGGAPSEIITEIEEIMNRGCRFWQDPSDLGNYDDPNLPLGNQA